MSKPNSIKIDDVEYIRADISQPAISDGLTYVIVRTQSAGVFAGFLESQKGQEIILRNARRLWYWDGAATLSQLAEEGVSKVSNCKFPQTVSKIQLFNVIEISDATKKAQESIASVKIWKA